MIIKYSAIIFLIIIIIISKSNRFEYKKISKIEPSVYLKNYQSAVIENDSSKRKIRSLDEVISLKIKATHMFVLLY